MRPACRSASSRIEGESGPHRCHAASNLAENPDALREAPAPLRNGRRPARRTCQEWCAIESGAHGVRSPAPANGNDVRVPDPLLTNGPRLPEVGLDAAFTPDRDRELAA